MSNQSPQNFKNGHHDRNGVYRSIYTGCCDAARDGFTGNKFDKYCEVNNDAYFARQEAEKKD